MKVIFRVDASLFIGSGHVMRCLVLADILKSRGFSVYFACLPQPGDMIAYIRDRGFDVLELTPSCLPMTPSHSADYKAWLQRSVKEDANDFLSKVDYSEWVIVDHYALDHEWESIIIGKLSCAILSIDDLNREHCSDIILDQNLWPNLEERYSNCSSTKLLGPEYALLRESFSILRDSPRDSISNQLLVFFGGTDPTNECEKFILAANEFERLPFNTILITGRINPRFDTLSKLNQNRSVAIYKNLESFDLSLSNSKYAIGASGVSNWERFCLKVPASIVSVAENQVVLSNYLSDLGFVEYLGEGTTTTTHTYSDELTRLYERWEHIKPFSDFEVDGFGANKVVQTMESFCREKKSD